MAKLRYVDRMAKKFGNTEPIRPQGARRVRRSSRAPVGRLRGRDGQRAGQAVEVFAVDRLARGEADAHAVSELT